MSKAREMIEAIRDAADTVNDTLSLFTDDPNAQGQAVIELLKIETSIRQLETVLLEGAA